MPRFLVHTVASIPCVSCGKRHCCSSDLTVVAVDLAGAVDTIHSTVVDYFKHATLVVGLQEMVMDWDVGQMQWSSCVHVVHIQDGKIIERSLLEVL